MRHTNFYIIQTDQIIKLYDENERFDKKFISMFSHLLFDSPVESDENTIIAVSFPPSNIAELSNIQ